MPDNFRLHGQPQYIIVAVHGGPGAIGEARPLAEELSKKYGVLEPLLLSEAFEANIAELKNLIETQAAPPVILIGHSYGAILSFVFAGRYPELVRKLIMVGNVVLEPEDVAGINETRSSRLSPEEAEALEAARTAYKRVKGKAKAGAFVKLFAMIQEADAYDSIPHGSDLAVVRPELYDSVWAGVQELGEAGKLAPLGSSIRCPVVAMQGDYDPRSPRAVHGPLKKYVKDLQCITLQECGHYPWYERRAREKFFAELYATIAEL